MKKVVLIIAVIVGVFHYNYAQTNQKINVEVKNVRSDVGIMQVTLFDSEATFLKDAFMEVKEEAKTGVMEFVFEDVKEGKYAISVVHDTNSNGELDTNFMGMPSEPYGISKDGKSSFGPPSYSKALFSVTSAVVNLTISL